MIVEFQIVLFILGWVVGWVASVYIVRFVDRRVGKKVIRHSPHTVQCIRCKQYQLGGHIFDTGICLNCFKSIEGR